MIHHWLDGKFLYIVFHVFVRNLYLTFIAFPYDFSMTDSSKSDRQYHVIELLGYASVDVVPHTWYTQRVCIDYTNFSSYPYFFYRLDLTVVNLLGVSRCTYMYMYIIIKIHYVRLGLCLFVCLFVCLLFNDASTLMGH